MRLRVWLLAGLGLTVLAGIPAGASAPHYHLIKKLPVGGEGGWDYLTFDSASHRLYVTRFTHVMVMNPGAGTVVGDIPDTQGVHGVALDQKLHRGFCSDGGSNTVTAFDTQTLKTIKQIKVGTRPDAIVVDPASNRVFTFNGGSDDATAVDARTLKVMGTIPLGGRPEFAAANGKGTVFVNIEDKSEVVAFDSRSLAVKSRWALSPGEGPTGIALDVAHNRVFSVCRNGLMVVLDTKSGRVVATPPIGQGPDAAAFDPKTGLAFSSNGMDGTLTVVREDSPDKFAVAENVQTQAGARTMALDPATHRIYLAAARFAGPLPKPGPPWHRPSFVPNSFIILEFGP